jgi:hypothetical protein
LLGAALRPRFEGGWTTEIAVPFKSLRYPAGREQMWGFNVLRMERKINQASSWSPLPASYGGAAIFKVSSAGTVVGLEAPSSGGILDLRPYVRGTLAEDRQAASTDANDGAFGFDAQFKATKSINFDVSYNTDFAQVEVDNQQLNLTRFSLFYPEKRAFFLEGQSNFTFGSNLTSTQPGSDAPIFFFSRQIGLAEGRTVPIDFAGRMMGRAGAFTIGAMTVRTGEGDAISTPATTFSVARVRRDILKRSSIGVLATDRRPAPAGESNQVLGVDANLRFFENVEVSSYYARSRTPSLAGDADTFAGQFRYAGDLLGAEAGHLTVGAAFNPEMGFLTRRGFARNFGSFRFSRRPARWGLRKVDWEGAVNDIASTGGDRQIGVVTGTFRVLANNGDQFSAVYTRNDDRPQRAFPVAGATIQPGAYRFDDTRVTYTVGPRRPVVGSIAFAKGAFYDGEKTESVITGRVTLDRYLAVEPSFTLTWLDMPSGRYDAQLLSTRTSLTLTPRMQLSALVQYSSTAASLGTNARFRWEYRPGSDLYVVYTDARDTLIDGYPALLNRSFAVKLTRLVQF